MATLIAGYGFAESTGSTALDVTGLHPGTISGATRTTSGKYGAALTFDGTNDIINIPHAADLALPSSLSLSAWVYPTRSLGDWQTIIMKEQSGEQAYTLAASTSTSGRPGGVVYLSTGKKYIYGTTALPLNAWSHLALTYDGTTIRFYVGGVQVSTLAATGTVVASTNSLHIGGNAIWGEYFGGRIDDVRIYSGALTAAEIQAAMAVAVDPTIPPEPPPVPSDCRVVLTGGVTVEWVWKPTPGTTGQPTGYTIETQPPSGAWGTVATTPNTVFTQGVQDLTLAQFYGYRVTPVGATLTTPAPVIRAAVQQNGTLVKE